MNIELIRGQVDVALRAVTEDVPPVAIIEYTDWRTEAPVRAIQIDERFYLYPTQLGERVYWSVEEQGDERRDIGMYGDLREGVELLVTEWVMRRVHAALRL